MAGKGRKKSRLERLVRSRVDYKLNQQSPVHGDRRTKRRRDRSSKKRIAIEEQRSE